jgi:hypothetical protein
MHLFKLRRRRRSPTVIDAMPPVAAAFALQDLARGR